MAPPCPAPQGLGAQAQRRILGKPWPLHRRLLELVPSVEELADSTVSMPELLGMLLRR